MILSVWTGTKSHQNNNLTTDDTWQPNIVNGSRVKGNKPTPELVLEKKKTLLFYYYLESTHINLLWREKRQNKWAYKFISKEPVPLSKYDLSMWAS